MFDRLLHWIGRGIAHILSSESAGYEPFAPSDPIMLRRILQPGDILLVEGNQRISSAIKYLTQSTWSHAALYVGNVLPEPADGGERPTLVEVTLEEGCIAAPISKYDDFNTRICRPVGLTPEDRDAVVRFMVDRLGLKYDTRNIVDLARYLMPLPPVPVRFRRRMIALGSGDPTRAICSTLIAQAFQSVRYPVLPTIESIDDPDPKVPSRYLRREILHIRHHSLYTPRDFDVSPYFAILKPTIELGFDYKGLSWKEVDGEGAPDSVSQPAGTPRPPP